MPKKAKVVYRGGERMKFVEMLARQSHFSKSEVERLLHLLKDHSKRNNQTVSKKGVFLDRSAFNDVLHISFKITDDLIIDRVFRVFDKDNDSFISEQEWIKGLSIILRGTSEEQIKYLPTDGATTTKSLTQTVPSFDKLLQNYILQRQTKGIRVIQRDVQKSFLFCFDVFDMNADGYISREEMFHLLKTSLVKGTTDEDPEEGVKDLVELAIKQLDDDHDGRVSYKDFSSTAGKEDMLLYSLGRCIPKREVLEEFSALISDVAHDSGMGIGRKHMAIK